MGTKSEDVLARDKIYYNGQYYDAPSAAWTSEAPELYRETPEGMERRMLAGYDGAGYKATLANFANLSPLEQDIIKNVEAKQAEYVKSVGGGGGVSSFNNTSSYKNPYAEQLDALTGKYLNRGPFTYDYTTDPLYQQYQKEYTRLGQRAMDDTIAKVSARTGGLASSYAGSAASQAYNNYMAALSNKIPELEQYAYGKYNDEGNTMLNQINLLRGLDSDAYGRYSSERAYGDSRADLAYDRNLAAQNQAFNRNLAGAQLLAQYGDMSGLEGVYGINGLQDKYNEANAVYAYGDDGTPYMISSAKGLNYLNTLPEGGSVTGGDGSTWTRQNGQVVITDANGRTYRYGKATPTYGGYLPQPQDGDEVIPVNMGDVEALGRGPMSAEQAVKYAVDNGYTITVENGQYRIKEPSLSNGPLPTNRFSISNKYKK